jgi:hypothetical protein
MSINISITVMDDGYNLKQTILVTFNDSRQLYLRLLALTLEANQLDFDLSAPTFATSEQVSAARNVRPILAAICKLQNNAYFYSL